MNDKTSCFALVAIVLIIALFACDSQQAVEVTFEAQDFLEAYDGIVALVQLASTGYSRIIQRVVLSREDGPEIFKEVVEQLFSDWIEVESGNWEPPLPREKGESSKKCFGAR